MTNAAIRKILLSKITIVILAGLLITLVVVQYRQFRQRSAISDEINHMKNQQSALEQKNQELDSSLQYLATSDFKDRLARQQLGLKKDGETVYSFADAPAPQPDAQKLPASTDPSQSNMKKWWGYLFSYH
jgi:cell division protein FtsB